jgi:hypothetical protein
LFLPDNHGKGANDFVVLGSCEEVKEDVVTEANGAEVLGEAVP